MQGNIQTHLATLDLAHIWHPCTQMKDHERLPIIPIKKAKGIYLYDFNDRGYIDCVSSWWVNLFGHCNDYINAAVKSQLDNLEHVILAGFSHEPIITLSKRLCEMLPQPLNKCFYADNGSSAIEVALKMSFHYFRNLKENRNLFLSLSNSYHGETIGTLSVGDVSLYKETYAPILLKTLRTDVPTTQFGDYANALENLETKLKEHGEKICAFILEPLIQCAGNMHMYNKEYIKEAVKLCKKYGIQIIFDEIAVGFGRTGSMFALEQCDVVPDYLCLSKGISGGYMPLSVVITSDSIYDVFYAPYSTYKAFLHSHSYTGNTLACAAANAVLDIFQHDNIIEKNKQLSLFMQKEFEVLRESHRVMNMRICGMVVAFEVMTEKERPNILIFEEGLKRGLLLRPLGNTIYFMPPYIITQDSISHVVKSLKEIIELL
ncbi:adenosylmethionine--8-amino-7-oxononanoate transaminase [Helicobacter trogontum]|uniref:Adenosylmethionine-8-amino-7-oxononanoate aminotransferase n=1 Tax=Helicobacter trogontum TaxID=50960 RepID=A0A4U8SFC6_9HELI|nr:adenosylmethionine--8-amino-7-oxononanoate transaminase [Helicobacter trogontum]TLD84930.1 adenosylmethionine--8-amino-7-oxononanoate transaminase [Helicobacter trogontum]